MNVFRKCYPYINTIILFCFVLNNSVTAQTETNDTKYNDTGQITIQNHTNYHLLPKHCGKSYYNSDRIIGGKEAQLGQFPWLARFGYKIRGCTTKILYRCGGVLINDLYVLSAAHCVTNLPSVVCPSNSENINFTFSNIALGEYDASTDPDCDDAVCAEPVQIFKPEKIIIHPNYNNPKFLGDISLVRLNRRAKLNGWTMPICLPNDAFLNTLYIGKKAEVAGWGTTNVTLATNSKVPMVIKLPILEIEKCLKSFAAPVNLSTESQICAGGEEHKDSCTGDSGGPLMVIHNDKGPKYFAIGLVSFGAKECGEKDKPAIYTRVFSYMEWILNNIEP